MIESATLGESITITPPLPSSWEEQKKIALGQMDERALCRLKLSYPNFL
jgi:hypothetical protein